MTAEVLLQGIVSGLLMGFVYALIAAGLSLIFGLMEIVNFAHGEFLMVAMFATLLGVGALAARSARLAAPHRRPALPARGRDLHGPDPLDPRRAHAGPDLRHLRARGLPALRGPGPLGRGLPAGQEPPRRGPASRWAGSSSACRSSWPAWALSPPSRVLYWFISRTETGPRAAGDRPGPAGRLADGHRHPAHVRARLGHRRRLRGRGGGAARDVLLHLPRGGRRPSPCSPT